eukprot:TRINITY_DN12303_c0_g1_i1.p1 TRINITY_DN12303_c0_g1~~TRINITY_DN12303_c0_g1_i1.p1  ORF type:complete len:657 (+),score=136.20 TRINITY_DN12303_c0_g1_i1:184-2154(+)
MDSEYRYQPATLVRVEDSDASDFDDSVAEPPASPASGRIVTWKAAVLFTVGSFVVLAAVLCLGFSGHGDWAVPLPARTEEEGRHAWRALAGLHGCSGNPAGLGGLRSCCQTVIGASQGIYKVRNRFDGATSCGLLDCATGEFVGASAGEGCESPSLQAFEPAATLNMEEEEEKDHEDRAADAAAASKETPARPTPERSSDTPERSSGNEEAANATLYGQSDSKGVQSPHLNPDNHVQPPNWDVPIWAGTTWKGGTKIKGGKAAWPDAPWCVGDVTSATVSTGAAGMHIAAAKHDCGNGHKEYCSRDIFAAVRNFARVAKVVSEGVKTCGGSARTCAQSISFLVEAVALTGEAASFMAAVCHTNPGDPFDGVRFSRCQNQLQRIAWFLAPLGQVTGASVVSCQPPDQRAGNQDMAGCIGSALSASAYVATAGLELAYIVDICSLAGAGTNPKAAWRCSQAVSTVGVVLSLAATRGSAAGKFCAVKGPQGVDPLVVKRSLCGRDISRMVAALFAATAWAARVHGKCQVNWNAGLCARGATGLVKELAMVAAKATDASNTCTGEIFANRACGSDISKAIASVAFAASKISEATFTCTDKKVNKRGLYPCSMSVEFIGQAVDVASRNIGNAVLDCGLPDGANRISHPVLMPRRFFDTGQR